mmetsp:Transcript_48102/g.119111  ORF Transcript_48102/g.119111 Transcript_48102/m.119111 type:complete len:253 (-) Transcript_48102:16-774(-)
MYRRSWMNSEWLVGTCVTSATRAITRATSGSSRQVALSHHVVYEVRISDLSGMNSSSARPPDAVDRSYRPSPCLSSASASSAERNRSKLTTHGSEESSCGSSSGKLESARSNARRIAPGGTASSPRASRGQRFSYCSNSHVPHASAQRVVMKEGLRSHSPAAAQASHEPLVSRLWQRGGGGEHSAHDLAHEACMYGALASHSPPRAQKAHSGSWSTHSGVSGGVGASERARGGGDARSARRGAASRRAIAVG